MRGTEVLGVYPGSRCVVGISWSNTCSQPYRPLLLLQTATSQTFLRKTSCWFVTFICCISLSNTAQNFFLWCLLYLFSPKAYGKFSVSGWFYARFFSSKKFWFSQINFSCSCKILYFDHEDLKMQYVTCFA